MKKTHKFTLEELKHILGKYVEATGSVQLHFGLNIGPPPGIQYNWPLIQIQVVNIDLVEDAPVETPVPDAFREMDKTSQGG